MGRIYSSFIDLLNQRLKEKLDILAALVMNQWPGIKLRVIESWDGGNQFAYDSLHYEGRAADITTSDKDNSKYGVLARLAVIAGFDWVLYESRHHVHVSVKSDKAASSRSEGCFTGDSLVYTRTGPIPLSQINIGEEILTVNPEGQITYSEILFFLDRDPSVERLYVNLITETGKVITLTQSHLIFTFDPIINGTRTNYTTSSSPLSTYSFNSSTPSASSFTFLSTNSSTIITNSSQSTPPIPPPSTWTSSSSTDPSDQWTAIFARYIEPGMFVSTLPINLPSESNSVENHFQYEPHLKPEKVVKVTHSLRKGAYAPLTRHGNVVVNQIVASCYAVVNDQALAHLSFLPVRLYYNLIESLNYIRKWLTLRLPSSSSTSSLESPSLTKMLIAKSSKSSKALSQPKLKTNQDNFGRLSLNHVDKINNNIRFNKKNVDDNNLNNGVHWYPRLLYSIAKYVISSDLMYF